MTHRALSTLALAFAVVWVAGCGQPAQTDTKVQTAFQQLAGQVRACATTAAACLKNANCDVAADQACRDDFATCRDQAKAAAEAFHTAVQQCRSDAHACWSAADGGTDARGACVDELKMCVADARPEPAAAPPCIADLRDCLQADGADARACLMQAHQCFLDSLPPRCDGDGGVVDGGWGFRGFPHAHGPFHGGDHHQPPPNDNDDSTPGSGAAGTGP